MKICQAINSSKTNLDKLRDIKNNPQKYFDVPIPDSLDITKGQLIKYMDELIDRYESIIAKTEIILEGQNAKLYSLYYNRNHFDNILNTKRTKLETDLNSLQIELDKLTEK